MIKVFDRIIEDLKDIYPFSDCKFRKRDASFIMSSGQVRFEFTVQHRTEWIISWLDIYPGYSVRADVLHKWMRKFSVLPLDVQRDDWSFILPDTDEFRYTSFEFNTEGKGYAKAFKKLSEYMVKKAMYYIPRYDTLQGCYDMEIRPVLEGKKDLPGYGYGIEWAFVDLALCKLVAPENYQEFKKMVLERIEMLHLRGEPNVKGYYDRIPEILHYLETTDITKIK